MFHPEDNWMLITLCYSSKYFHKEISEERRQYCLSLKPKFKAQELLRSINYDATNNKLKFVILLNITKAKGIFFLLLLRCLTILKY